MQHLLLASHGDSPGALLATLHWLNERDQWDKRRPPDDLPHVTHLWVVTTQRFAANLDGDLQRPLAEHFPTITWRILIAPFDDILNETDQKVMSEILHRLVLKGETWRGDNAVRRFSVSISGGRKMMSADLQRAATFFKVDNLLQMVYDDSHVKPSDTYREVVQYRANHHPVIISRIPSPWRPLLEKPWLDDNPGQILSGVSFPVNPERDNEVVYIVPIKPDLILRLDRLADNTKRFADDALACGVGPLFLRHDLAPILETLGVCPSIPFLFIPVSGDSVQLRSI